jgi:4-azaleucine resistance transporter AzlC
MLKGSRHRSPLLREFTAGARDQLSLLVGVIPLGLVFGALGISIGLPAAAVLAFSLLVFAGSSQFLAVDLIGKGAPPLVIVLAILIINLRHALYSATLAPHLQHLSRRWKWVLAWLLTDEAFAMASRRYRSEDLVYAHWYTLGTGLALFLAWQGSTAAGIFIGARVPQTLPLDFMLPLTFLAILLPSLKGLPNLVAAITAGTLSVAFASLPQKLGVLLAIGLGIAAGVLTQRLRVDRRGGSGGE